MRGLVDSHCHLDAAEFDPDRAAVLTAAIEAGVEALVLPAVERANFDAVLELGRCHDACAPALGIHPMYVDRASDDDLAVLRDRLASEPVVAVGEIGLDHFVEGYDAARQEHFLVEQLKLAREFDLPVLLHVRRAQDAVLKQLRRFRVRGGIAHAFNGSRQQADEYLKLGFRLGFGGAMTYPRALRIRELAATLPLDAIVLETDAPDMPPAWLAPGERNSPRQLPRIAEVLAELRGENVAEMVDAIGRNVLATLPALPRLCTRLNVVL